MSKITGRAGTHEQWLEQLWHVHCGLLDIASLTAQRAIERRELVALKHLAGQMAGGERNLHILDSQVRYLVDTGDIGRAETEVESLIGEAEKSGQREHIRKAYSWRAVIRRELSRYPQAIDDFQRAEELSDNELQLMELWLDKGMTLSYANRFPEAEEMLKKSIQVAGRYNDLNSQGTAWNNLGICYGQQRFRERAVDAYSRALECYQRTGYKLGSAMVSGNVAEILIGLGQLDKAMASVENCIKLGTEAEDIISIGLGHDLKGRLLNELGEPEAAISSIEKSLAIYDEVGDDFAWVICMLNLVPLQARAGLKEEAQENLDLLEEKAAGLGSTSLDREIRQVRAMVLLETGDLPKSLELLEQILTGPESGDKDRTELQISLSRAHLSMGKQEAAMQAFEDALGSIVARTTVLRQVEVYRYGEKLYSSCGLPDKAAECRARMIELLGQIKNRIEKSDVWERYIRKKGLPAR